MSVQNGDKQVNPRPYAVLGSGDLVSHLQRDDLDPNSKEYRFNVFRLERDEQVTHALRPIDLRSMVKLCQVLAFTIADDGWVSDDVRSELFELADDLDYITHQWSRMDHGSKTPDHEIRRGLIVVRVWHKRSKSGSPFSLTVVRLYRNGDQWKESSRLGRDDIPLVRLALDEAYRWILKKELGNPACGE